MKHIHGGDIYTNDVQMDFSANISPFGPSEDVIRAMSDCLFKVGHYPDVNCKRLRREIAVYEEIPTEYITCGNGAADIIYSLVLAKKPRKALLITPTFAEYEQALLTVACKIEYVNLNEGESFKLTESYLQYLTEELDMIFLCSPNNPTGVTIDKSLLIEILNICRKRDILFVLDECFIEFINEPDNHTMKEYLNKSRHLFIINAFTKIHAIPGVRLGYGMTSNKELLEQINGMRQPWSVSLIAQEAGIAALQKPKVIKEIRNYIRIERMSMVQEFKRIGIQFIEPEANFICIKSEYDLYEILRQRGILIRDCSNYKGLAKGFYRVAIKLGKENQQLIRELEKIYQIGGASDGKTNYDSGDDVQCG